MKEQINQEFFLSDAITLAKNLLGKILVRNIDGTLVKARIVETEAYLGGVDRASHSYGFKKTSRMLPLYEIGGTVYVYLIYGMYHCFNIAASTKDNPEAVLIRAVEIIEGHDAVRQYLPLNNRHKSTEHWTNGPGKLALALKIDRNFNYHYLLENDSFFLISDDFLVSEADIVAAKRIGIGYAGEDTDNLWRFYLKDNLFVSKKVK